MISAQLKTYALKQVKKMLLFTVCLTYYSTSTVLKLLQDKILWDMVFFMGYDVIQEWGVKMATIFGFTKNYNLYKLIK